MASEVAAALIATGGAIVAAVLGVWQANAGLRRRSDARVSDPELLARRWDRYADLWNLTRLGPRETYDGEQLRELSERLRDWYYPNGMLLSDASQRQWVTVRDLLAGVPAGPIDGAVWDDVLRQVSLLRSWLKADLNIRTFEEVAQTVIVAAETPARPV